MAFFAPGNVPEFYVGVSVYSGSNMHWIQPFAHAAKGVFASNWQSAPKPRPYVSANN